MIYAIEIDGQSHQLELLRTAQGAPAIRLDGEAVTADVFPLSGNRCSLIIAGRSFTFAWAVEEATSAGRTFWLGAAGRQVTASVRDPRRLLAQGKLEQSGKAQVRAPMAGKVVKVLVSAGAAVKSGQGILVLEAMKMQNEVRSPKSGTIVACAVSAGDTVATHQLLAEVE